MKTEEIYHLQLRVVGEFLSTLLGRHNQLGEQIIELIISFVYASPFRQRNVFVLKKGRILIKYDKHKVDNLCHFFSNRQLSGEIIHVSKRIKLNQNDQIIVSNKFNEYQRIGISKIWEKPRTRTQKKILIYYDKFKQFLQGTHLRSTTIDLSYLDRQFVTSEMQQQQFLKDLSNIIQNDANACSLQVLESFLKLVAQNYIEIQLQDKGLFEKQHALYKVIKEGSEVDILPGIKLAFKSNSWELEGEQMTVWKKSSTFSQRKQLIRFLDAKVQLVEACRSKDVQEIQLLPS